MARMAKLSYREKLPGRSVQAVRDLYDDALCLHQRARKIHFGGRRITAEAFTNAAMLWFLDHDFDEQERILMEYVPRFVAMVEADPAGPAAVTPTEIGKPGKAPRKGRKGAG